MFANYKHKLGVGCVICKHVWFILTNDDIISDEIQVYWVKDVMLEHDAIHEEKGYEQGFQE